MKDSTIHENALYFGNFQGFHFGKHGKERSRIATVIVNYQNIGPVTFPMRYWQDKNRINAKRDRGCVIAMRGLHSKPGGWRARQARFARPEENIIAIDQGAIGTKIIATKKLDNGKDCLLRKSRLSTLRGKNGPTGNHLIGHLPIFNQPDGHDTQTLYTPTLEDEAQAIRSSVMMMLDNEKYDHHLFIFSGKGNRSRSHFHIHGINIKDEYPRDKQSIPVKNTCLRTTVIGRTGAEMVNDFTNAIIKAHTDSRILALSDKRFGSEAYRIHAHLNKNQGWGLQIADPIAPIDQIPRIKDKIETWY